MRLAGETSAPPNGCADMMVQGHSAAAVRPVVCLPDPRSQPPAGLVLWGKVICNCFDVAEDDILAAFLWETSLRDVGPEGQVRHQLWLLCARLSG